MMHHASSLGSWSLGLLGRLFRDWETGAGSVGSPAHSQRHSRIISLPSSQKAGQYLASACRLSRMMQLARHATNAFLDEDGLVLKSEREVASLGECVRGK